MAKIVTFASGSTYFPLLIIHHQTLIITPMTPQEFFKNDRFAANAGVELMEIREGYSKARLVITAEHLNAGGRTQGGALFTLADLALAAAANSHGTLAFSLSSNITFLRGSEPGDVLYAEARERYIGRSTGYYQIDVTNQEGKLIATFESSVFRKGDITFSLPQMSSDSGCPGHS